MQGMGPSARKPNLLPAVLAQLPAHLTALELRSFSVAQVPAALARFSALARLDITGNARDVYWAEPQVAALLPLLHTLRLKYLGDPPPAIDCFGGVFYCAPTLPDSAASALAAASRLEQLELRVQCWTDGIGQLCLALPALRDLRWAAAACRRAQCSPAGLSPSPAAAPTVGTRPACLPHCAPPNRACRRLTIFPEPGPDDDDDPFPRAALEEGLPLAVAALRRLSQLTALALAVGTRFGSPVAECVQLPPLAGLSALTQLELRPLTLPPPDWTGLASLRRLSLSIKLDWAAEPLAALTSLTRVKMRHRHRSSFPDPSRLARLPSLASVRAMGASPEWRTQLTALRPDVACAID